MTAIACVLDARAETGEGPVWSAAEGRLYWVDIPRCEVHRFDPASGRDETWRLPSPVGCVAPRAAGGLVVALADGFHRFDPESGASEVIADPEPDRPGNRFNDGAVDPKGRFIAGTMPNDGQGSEPRGALYALDPDGRTRRLMDGFWTQNGVAFAPDGRTLYVSDTDRRVRTIWACPYDPETGKVGERRVFFDTHGLDGRPDGGAVDAEGFYWMAGVGGWQVARIAPDGRLDRVIDLPVERPTKPAFGGPDLRTLYVTSAASKLAPGSEARQPHAGGLFALDVGVRGLPVPPYAG